MNGDLFSGLLMLAFIGISIGVILARGEANRKRQDEEYDKVKEEYDKAEQKRKEQELKNK